LHSGAHGGRSRLRPGRLLTKGPGSALCAAAMGLIGLGFYLATLAPGLTWAHDSGDGGELAAAAHTLGIPHPPGYPTYLLLAHLFTLLPVGEIATRTNLLSAVCAAGTSALLTWTLARTGGKWACAVGAGLALAFSPLLWSQATVTEVHALNGLFTALLLASMVLTKSDARRCRWPASLLALAIGGVWGLSLGNHLTALFCGPLVFLVLWRLGRSGAMGVIGIALGLTVYLYLPLRAAADPPINWGDPRTLERLWWTVSGAPYRQFVFSLPRQYLPARLLAWSGLLTQQFGWIGLMVTTLGAMGLWKADRPLLIATGMTTILCSIFAIGYDTSDSYLYLIPALICLGLWLGTGLDWLFSLPEARRGWAMRATQLGAALVILLPLGAAVHRFSAQDVSDDRTAYDFETAVLGQAPSKALILSQRDTHTFSLWYFQHALGRRPDVVTVDLDLLGYDWYTAQLSRQLAVELPSSLTLEGKRDVQRWVETLGRPVCQIGGGETGLTCMKPGIDQMRSQ
jgi:hypothetical protein